MKDFIRNRYEGDSGVGHVRQRWAWGGGREGMQVDRYASNVTAKIFEFIMFIFKKKCTYGANNGRGW